MRKSRISFSLNKKTEKKEGGDASSEAQTGTNQQASLKPSSYFACRFCCKRFKAESSYETHSKTKHHAKAVKLGSASELAKSRTCAGCQKVFDSRPQLVEHCKRNSHMPLVQKTGMKDPLYGKAYTEEQQEDPFVSIKYYSPYYCEVCDLDCVSDVHYQDHIKGTRHEKAVEKRAEQGRGALVDIDAHEVDTSEKCLVIMNKLEPVADTVSAYYCGICDTDCRSELAYTEHVTSKDHQVRMQGHGQLKISCDLCCMTFTSENNYKMHLRSKKHANNVAARQRLLPLGAAGGEKGESIHDLRDKIKRTLSPPLENFEIKVNVSTPASKESAERQVVVSDNEMDIEEDDEQFMEMGRPNVGGGSSRDRKELDKKFKEDEEERKRWAKKKEEDFAKRKAGAEKTLGSSKWAYRDTRDSRDSRAVISGGRGGRGWGRGTVGGRGIGRVKKDDKYTWVRPGGDDDSSRARSFKSDGKEDNADRRDKSDKRESKSDRREKRMRYEDERGSKKYKSDSDDDYDKRVIVKKSENRSGKSPSPDDDGDDLRNVIKKQRGRGKSSTEGTSNVYDYNYGLERGKEDGSGSLVFDYGHKSVEQSDKGKIRETGERAELKGFFGGALSSLAGHLNKPELEAPDVAVKSERYYDEERPDYARSQYPPRDGGEKAPKKEGAAQNVEKTLLLELLKRQFPDIRYLTEQQGGLELMQRIFGDVSKGGALGLAGIDLSGGLGLSDSGGGGNSHGLREGLDDGRKEYEDDYDEPKAEGDVEKGTKQYQKKEEDIGAAPYEERRKIEVIGAAQPSVMTSQASLSESRRRSPESDDERGRGSKKDYEKSSSKSKRDSRRDRKRSRSRERRRRSRSRSGSRSRSRRSSKYSSRRRSRSSSRDRSYSKKHRRSRSPEKSSSKRKRSTSPSREDSLKAEKKDGVGSPNASGGTGDLQGENDKGESVVSQMKARIKDAKDKVLAKWTVSNWSGDNDMTSKDEKEEESVSAKDKEETERIVSKRYDREQKEDKKTSEREGRVSSDSTRKTEKEGNKIFDDASDYEDIDVDDRRERDLRKKFEEDYDDLAEPQAERRRDRNDGDRSLRSAKETQKRSHSKKASRGDSFERSVPRVGDVRESISKSLLTATEQFDFDQYNYENRAFKAQQGLGIEGILSAEILAKLARAGIPYESLGLDMGRGQGIQSMAAGQGLGAAGASGLRLGSGLGLEGDLALGRGIGSARGKAVRGRGSSGPRNNSALMYIQPTEDDQSHQVGAAAGERVQAATSQARPRLASSQASAAATTISPVLLASRPGGSQGRLSLGGSRAGQILDSGMQNLEEDEAEEELVALSDLDQFSSDLSGSRPLKSILKKQSKFTSDDVADILPSDTVTSSSSGNMPKNAVGAEYVVPNTGEQGKFFCQLCHVQFTTLSAKNLHLRGPKHLAMFMKHKSPLIDQMIQQAMGTGSLPQDENVAQTLSTEVRAKDLESVKELSRAQPAQPELVKRESLESSRSMAERKEAPLRDPVTESREAALEESLVRGYPADASYSGLPREKISEEPLLYLDEKTGKVVEVPRYYGENLARNEGIRERYGRLSEDQYSQVPLSRDSYERGRDESLGSSRDDYERLATRDEYDQLRSREKYLLSRDEYDRLPRVSERDTNALRDEYQRALRRDDGLGLRQEYGRLAADEAMYSRRPDEYGRVPARETRPVSDEYDRYPSREDLQGRDEHRRLAAREQTLPVSEAAGRPSSREAYGRPASRETYTDERDRRSDRSDRTPPAMGRATDQTSDWPTGRSYDNYESRTRADDRVSLRERDASQYGESARNKSSSRDWDSGMATSKEAATSKTGEAKVSVSEASVKRVGDSPSGYEKPAARESAGDVQKPRENSERYSVGYDSRSLPERRDTQEEYGQASYREQYDRGYKPADDRYRGREPQAGYGYETPRRGGGGSRGTRARGMGGRGGPRGHPRGQSYNRPPQRQWRGGSQGRY